MTDPLSRIDRAYRWRWAAISHSLLFLFVSSLVIGVAVGGDAAVARDGTVMLLVWFPCLLVHMSGHVLFELREQTVRRLSQQTPLALGLPAALQFASSVVPPAVNQTLTRQVDLYDETGKPITRISVLPPTLPSIAPMEFLPPGKGA